MSPSATVLLALLAASSAAAEVITKPGGLQIEDTRTIKCDRPTQKGDTIFVHYKGTLTNGMQFDESWDRGQPFKFKLGEGHVILGWDMGLLDMCVGTRRKLTIPPEMAYGGRSMGVIPANSVLLFETQLMHIEGVKDPSPIEVDPPEHKEEEAESKIPEDKDELGEIPPAATAVEDKPATATPEPQGDKEGPAATGHKKQSGGECRLLGPFALVVQAALGVLALMSLVFKRWRERPRRPLLIWFFDASKQVVGTALLHVANLAMSMFSSGVTAAAHASKIAEASSGDGGKMPNPCSFYLLNLAIDTTIGIPILVILLRVLHALFLRTPLANPPESLKSGHYGEPPHVMWWIKQSFIYFIGLFGMKLFVLFLFKVLPWLPWVGDWALRWTEGNESVQIAFVMFIFPLAMNAMQYYIIDTFIKEKREEGYSSVHQDDDSSGDGASRPLNPERRSLDEDEDGEDKPTPVVSAAASSGSDSGSSLPAGATKATRPHE